MGLCGSFRCGCGIASDGTISVSGSGEPLDPFTLGLGATPIETWVPVLTQGVVVTHTVSRAMWVNIAGMIHFNFQLAITSSGTAGQNVLVTLPAAAAFSVGAAEGSGFITDNSAGLNYGGSPYLLSPTTVGWHPTTIGVGFGLLGPVGFTAALANLDGVQLAGSYPAA